MTTLEPTEAQTVPTDRADGSILLPPIPVEVTNYEPIPSLEEINTAKAELDQIFNGEYAADADARFRRGLQDAIKARETDDARFYIHCEALASVANRAYDRPRQQQ